MRTRAVSVARSSALALSAAVTVLSVLTLSACSTEAGPTPKASPDPGPAALKTKLDALTVDPCFTQPGELAPQDCEKYVTQVANVPGTAEKYADADHPKLREAAASLTKGVDAYRAASCDSAGSGGGSEKACDTALTDIASALDDVEAGVLTLPEVSATSG